MATVKQSLFPGNEVYPSTAFASYVQRPGSNFPVAGIWFDPGAADTKCYFSIDTSRYGSGALTVDIDWYADGSATSGTVKFGARLAAITPNTDSQDIESKAFAAQATGVDAHLGTTARRLHTASLSVSALDALAANDACWLELARVASDAVNDTLPVGAIVTRVTVSYSDT